MKLFPHAHATHPQWRMAAALVLAQLRAQLADPRYASAPPLGLLYLSDRYADEAQAILDHLGAELPEVVDWAGAVGVGICAGNAEYLDEPALAVMLCDLKLDHYRVFSGIAPLPARDFAAALLHADAGQPEIEELIAEMAQRTGPGLFGGLVASRGAALQFARSAGAGGVFEGGMSGVAFRTGVGMITRLTQGVKPLSRWHRIDRAEGNIVLGLDGRAALDLLLEELGIDLDEQLAAVARLRRTLVGIDGATGAKTGGATLMRHLIGVDPVRRGIAVAGQLSPQGRILFCERDVAAARADLVRVCTEIREAIEPQERSAELAAELADDAASAPHPARRIAGAIYVSCNGGGGPWFGSPGAELQIVRRALGDVPLVGFFAGGEIAGDQLHAYSGVLTVFVAD